MVLQYDVGRLLFVASTASQLARLSIQSNISSTRFTVDMLDLPSSTVQIHLISIGGRSYISNLSDSFVDCGTLDTNNKYHDIRGSNYLAIKSDGIGVVDIAFEQEKGQPKWILHNPSEPFATEISQIRDTSLQSLRIVRDTLKCRAIIQSNRGPEPYFHKPPFPPNHYWVNPGFLIESKLTELKDPFIYFIRATYIPFANITRISFDFDSGIGIADIYVNDEEQKERYSVTFDEPPTTLKLVACQNSFLHYHYPFIQFKVNGQWVPVIPPHCIVSREALVENVVKLWLGKTFEFTPAHIGIVVSQHMDIRISHMSFVQQAEISSNLVIHEKFMVEGQ